MVEKGSGDLMGGGNSLPWESGVQLCASPFIAMPPTPTPRLQFPYLGLSFKTFYRLAPRDWSSFIPACSLIFSSTGPRAVPHAYFGLP